MSNNLATAEKNYSPLYFLSALGAGGLTVTFFMYLMFWVPHKGRPVPTFDDISVYFQTASSLGQLMVIVAMAGIAFFAAWHFKLLAWNFKQMAAFKQTERYTSLVSSNAETQLTAMPLAVAMGVNVGFIVGLVFVPGLWGVVEVLFPFAMATFAALGLWLFGQIAVFLKRVIANGDFDHSANTSFAQALPAFALTMVAVGFAAPSAMSVNPLVVGVSIVGATFFGLAALLIAIVAIVIAVKSMLEHGASAETAPTLLIVIPMATTLGIAMLRMDHGLHTVFDVHASSVETFTMLTKLLSLQVIFGLFGLAVLRAKGYGKQFLSVEGKRSAGSYALVCPGVAMSVMWHFWVNKGWVAAGLITKFSAAYWVATVPALLFQVAMIYLVFKLANLHFSASKAALNAKAA